MSSCAREKGGALHTLLTQQSAPPPPQAPPSPPSPPSPAPARPPQSWPTTRKAAEKMREARRLKNIIKKKEQRQRRKARNLEVKLKAQEDAESRLLLLLVDEEKSAEELRKPTVEGKASAAVPREEEEDTTREAPAAFMIQRAWRAKKARRRYGGVVIQRAWRTKVVRTRYAEACAVKQAERRRQRRAVRSICKAWRQFQARKALAYAKARVDDKMAPHRRKRAELMRAAAVATRTEDAGLAESSSEGLGCGHSASAAAAGAVTDEAGPRAAAGAGVAAGAAGAGALAGTGAGAAGEVAAAAAAHMPAVGGVAGLASGRLGNVLLDTIAATRRRKDEEAAARAAVNAQARAEFEAIFAASEAEMVAGEEAEDMERAALAQEVLKKTFKVLRDQYAEAIRKKKARMAKIRPLLRLPPSRKDADTASAAAVTGPTIDLVPHPFQSLQGGGGHPPQYSQRGVDFRKMMDRLKGVPLPLGVAPVWGATGVPRSAEEFASACGFSAAFGPLLLQRAAAKVFGKEAFSSGVRGGEELPEGDVAYVFGRFWEEEIAPFGPVERFFRLVGNPGRGGIVKEELRPFLMAIAERHSDLAMLTPDDVSAYVDTVLAVLYHKHSRCGVISLRDLRTSGFVASLNATGRLELGLEDSECLSVSRHETIRGEYLSLCCGGRGVGHGALRGYRHKGGATVGAVRASRVIEADSRRQRSRCNSSGGVLVSTMGGEDEEGGHGDGNGEDEDGQKQQLGYDAWVRFFLCEEGLRAGECSERDVRFCFDLVDTAAAGRVGVEEVAPFYDDMKREYVSNGGNPDKFKACCDKMFCQNLDAMGVEAGRQYVTAVEMRKAGNVKVAGRFFSRLFLGLQFKRDKNAAKRKKAENCRPPPPAPPSVVSYQQPPQQQQQYVQCQPSPGYQQYPWYPQHEYEHQQQQYLGFQQQSSYRGQYEAQYQDPYQGYQQYSPHQRYEPPQQRFQEQQYRAQPQVAYGQKCQQAYPAWDAGCQWQPGYAGDGQSCSN